MALFFYNIFLLLYRAGISVASLLDVKAKLWANGRKNILELIAGELVTIDRPIIWVHCSSLGEFEQGRPVIETLKSNYPDLKILLTFFSPSGYEIRKDYKGVDWVFYLPLDSRSNAKQFLDIVNPTLVVFVKYAYWYYYLAECKKRNIPLLMVSAIFRDEQPFFKWYGSLHRKMLNCFTHFFVQDKESVYLLASINIKNVTIAGDTRFDRVSEIAKTFKPIPIVEKFCGHFPILVAGSTWREDEEMLQTAISEKMNPAAPYLKLIIAPHEINEKHLADIKKIYPGALWFSNYDDSTPITNEFAWSMLGKASHVLVIDNIGMLSRLYQYATIAYVGGGFDKGIHNTLEAAVYGKPVLFGPNYKKFKEAVGLIETGGGICVGSGDQLSTVVKKLLNDKAELKLRSQNSFEFVKQNRGATEKIITYIEENRLLTN